MPPGRFLQGDYRPSDEFLGQIDRLDKSSPQFSDQLTHLFRGKRLNFAAKLEREDRDWLIEYLDNALSALDPVNRAHLGCLDHLGWACWYGEKFPQSQILDVSSLVSIPNPTPIGLYETCYEGLLNNSRVCVKKLKPDLAQKWKTSPWSHYHAFKWKYLRHPNIVPFLGFTNEPIQFVSALVPGKSVTAYITSSPDTVDPLSLLTGIASGLECLHSFGVVHGDLGGPNIIIDDSGHPRITNFGLLDMFLGVAADKVVACKRWASPEALSKRWFTYQTPTDIFSFAMVIVEVFTGQIPFFPETDSMAQSAIVQGKRPARPTHPDLTDTLWGSVERCWNEKGFERPHMDEVVRILDDCRRESMRKDSQITQISGSSETAPQNSTLSKNQPLSVNDTSKEDGSNPGTGDKNTPILPSAPPPSVPADWLSQIANEILDLTDQVASVALFGPIGVGKSFIACATLGHDRTRTSFGDNCHFIRCDDLQNSPDSFIERLSGAIHIDVARLRSHLESSPPLMLVLDGVDSFLDPLIPEADEVLGMMEEFGSYKNVCLVTTSRMYPNIRGFHRINIPTPPVGAARDMFHSLCDLDRSSTLDTLIAKLDFHPLSIKLLASAVRENNWDEVTVLKLWEDPTSAFKENYYQRLKDAIEPVFRSPTLEKLGDAARDVLFAIASFPSGIGEGQLEGIFHARGGVGEVVDVLCRFSLVSRRDGIVRMPSPFQLYFLESMLVVGELGEVIKWGPDCMPAQAWLPIYTQGPPGDWFPDSTSHPTPRHDTGDRSLRETPVFTRGPPETGLSGTTPRPDAPTRKKWIRRLPKIIKQRLLVLFGHRIKPTILVELYEGPASIPPIDTQEGPTDVSPIAPQEDPSDVSSTPPQAPAPVTPTATQDDPTDMPPITPQNDPTDVPHPEPDGDPTDASLATPQQPPHWFMPEAYEVW